MTKLTDKELMLLQLAYCGKSDITMILSKLRKGERTGPGKIILMFNKDYKDTDNEENKITSLRLFEKGYIEEPNTTSETLSLKITEKGIKYLIKD